MTATSTAASSLPPVRTSCHVPLSLMTSISEETIALWLKLGALEKLEQAVLDGYGDQLCGKTSRIPQVNKFLKQVPLFQNKIREIHQAVSQGRLRDVQHLIDRKKLAFCRDHNGASPLHKAVIFGHQDVIEYLVKRYAGSIHIRDHQGRTALHYAAFLPDRGEIYQYLLANGADERAMDVYGRQPSYYLDGQNESTLRQLRDGSTLNGLRKIKPRYYGQVTAGQPFTNSNRPMVTKSQIRELISDGNLNALEDLVLQGQGDRLLGETSSVPKIQSFLNIVPMYMERIYDVHRAVMRDQLEHVVILLENKKLAMARDQLGATPLHKAVLFGHYKIAHYISHQFPESLNAIDMEGRTALHYAAALKDNKNMYGILIEAGANKGIYDNKGKTADYYAQYPEHLNLEEVIKRCHKVNANYLANTASRIKGKSPVRQTPPPSNGNLSSPRSEENNVSSKDTSQSTDSGNENELMTLLQKDKIPKRLDMSSANIRRWVNAKDMDKLTKAVMEGYGDKVVRVNTTEEYEDKEQINGRITEMVERINAIHSAVSSDDLTELQTQLEERDFALAKDHMGNTPLHKSVLLRKTKIVGFLIEKFPETINAKNKNGLTALHYAAAMSRKDGLQLYKMLLQAGADPKIRDNHGRTPDYYKTHLITLPKQGMMRTRPIGGRHSETLNRYSKQGVLERMTTALNRGDVELLQDLVLEGHGKHLFGKTSWNEDVKTYLKELPSYLNIIQLFHEACRHGDVETVNELVADNEKLMRARDESGALPIHMAAARESSSVLEYFAKNYPSAVNAKDSTGKTALHIVSQRGNVALCKLLKAAGADAKILDQKGKTADFYLQNAIKDGVKTDNDSSKSSINSSSDSSYSINQRESLYKKKSRGRLKKPMFRGRVTEGIEVATTNGVPERNEDIVENTEQEQEDTENAEESERKESISEADGSKELDAEQAPVDEEADEEDTKDIKEEEEEEKGEENASEEEENEVEAKEDTIMVDLQTEDAEESTEAEKTEDVTETSPTNNEDEDNIEAANENEEDADDPSADSKEDNEDTEINEDETTENADTVVEVGDIDTEETDKDEEKVENEELKDDHNDESVEEENADDVPQIETKEDEEKEEEEEEKEKETEEKGEEEQLDDSSSPKDDTDNTEQLGDNNEEAKPEPESEENKEEESEATEVANDLGGVEDDNAETDNKDNEEEKEEDSGNVEDKENETDLEGVIVADVGSGNEQSNEDPEKQDTEENGNEEETPESTEDHPENQEEGKDITESNVEDGETEITEETQEDNEGKNDIDTKEEEEKNEDGDQEDVNGKEEEKEDNAKEEDVTEEEKLEEDKDTPEDESNNTNDATADKENEEEMQTETIELKDEAGEEAENNDMNQGEITENGTSNHNDAKTNGHDETPHQTKDHLDELIEHWIKEGDLLRLEHVVLAGQGDRLIERTSDDKQVQDFLDLVPIYMAKIRAVHEAVAKGQLREVRSVLTRKRFALSRDHVGASPLHLAVLHGHTDVSTYIISHFPETMDGPDNEGRTPLHYAAALRDNGTLYRLLRSAGADENIEDKAGHSPKYYMSYPGRLTLETLLEPYSTSE